jgi:hypothetical protein
MVLKTKKKKTPKPTVASSEDGSQPLRKRKSKKVMGESKISTDDSPIPVDALRLMLTILPAVHPDAIKIREALKRLEGSTQTTQTTQTSKTEQTVKVELLNNLEIAHESIP